MICRRVVCRHCSRERQECGRGLCIPCHRDPTILALYPTKVEMPHCWACGTVAPRFSSLHKIGWYVRYIKLTSGYVGAEMYCNSCFAEWGWPDTEEEANNLKHLIAMSIMSRAPHDSRYGGDHDREARIIAYTRRASLGLPLFPESAAQAA